MKTTKEVTTDFLNVILEVISRNSSKNYGLVALKRIQKTLSREFPFFRLVKIDDNKIKVESIINSVDTKKIRLLFVRTIEMLGPNLLKLLIKERLDAEDIKYLNKIGVKF